MLLVEKEECQMSDFRLDVVGTAMTPAANSAR